MDDINVNSFLYSGGVPIYPESLPIDHVLVEIETLKTYTVLDFLDHNNNQFNSNFEADLNEFLLYATLEDEIGNQFTLSVDMHNNIYLQAIAQQTNVAASFLSIEDFTVYLKEFKLKLNTLRYYVNYSAKIYKEAIQDAVDIVQSKRLDYLETKEEKVDVSGILTVAISLAFFEFGLGAAAFGFIASKLGSSVFIKTVLNTFFKMLGKKGAKQLKVSNIKALEDTVNELMAMSKKLSQKSKIPLHKRRNDKSKHRKLKLERKADKLDENAKAIQKQINDIKIEEERYQNELLKLGKEVVLDVVKNNKGNVRDISEPFLEEGLKELTTDSGAGSLNSIPLDVYFKTNIQNFYETPLLVIDKMLILLDEMIFYQECYGIETDEELSFYQFFLNEYSLSSIESSIIAYQNIFNQEDFSFTNAKFSQTKEYELTLWVLLLKDKITREWNPLMVTDSDPFNPGPIDPAVPLFISVLNSDSNLTQYLANRFGLSIKNSELATSIENAYQCIISKKDYINNQLETSKELIYKIDLNP